jgi:hypothetical protein
MRDRRLRALVLFACLAAGAGPAARPAAGLDWPVRRPVLTATFGEERTDHFHNGIDLGGGEQDVLAVLPGEVVFRSEEESDYTSLPRGVGSFVVLRHADGIESVYCHLKKGSMDARRDRYAASEKIGIMGETGYSEGTHLHFIVLDSETSSFVNPLALLPPLADGQAPVIRRVWLAVGDRQRPLEQGGEAGPGRVEVLADLFDPRADVSFLWPMAPYTVLLSLDGREIARLAFDALQVADGRALLRGTRLTAADVYTAEGLMRLGSVDLRPGASRLLLTARDFAGNEASRDIVFSVRE